MPILIADRPNATRACLGSQGLARAIIGRPDELITPMIFRVRLDRVEGRAVGRRLLQFRRLKNIGLGSGLELRIPIKEIDPTVVEMVRRKTAPPVAQFLR